MVTCYKENEGLEPGWALSHRQAYSEKGDCHGKWEHSQVLQHLARAGRVPVRPGS